MTRFLGFEFMRRFTPVALACLLSSASAEGQQARLIASTPSSELSYEFTRIVSVLELADGRVLVLDQGDGTVLVGDYKTRQVTRIGRQGSGPGEYRLPALLLPLGGDSAGVVDGAEARILVITRQGKLGGFLPLRATEAIAGVGLPPRAHASDAMGWFYAEGSAVHRGRDGTLLVVDSAPVARWRMPASAPEILGFVRRPLPEGARVVGGAVVVAPGTALPEPQTRDRWAVGQDGTLAIVVPVPYHVKLRSPRGTWSAGPEIPYPRTAVNDSVKRAYLSEREPGGTVVLNQRTGSYSIVKGSQPRPEPALWAKEVPPFLWNAFVGFEPGGILWIQRSTFGNEGARYDLVNSRGELVDQVRLPVGHRVAGFGRGSIFIVRRDADDLEYLQRHPAVPR